MSKVDLDKLRSVRQGGKTAGKARVRELTDGDRVTGFEVDHADGRKSAVVRPQTVRQKVSIKEL